MQLKPMATVSVSRRDELLLIARRSRVKWVLEEKEVGHERDRSRCEPVGSSSVPADLKAKIPAAESIQNVLNYLTGLIDDGELCDVVSIAAGIIDYDDYDNEQYVHLSKNKGDRPESFNDFLAKLILPASTEVVKSLQQFVTKFSADFHAAKTGTIPVDVLPDGTDEENLSWPTRIWSFLDHTYDNMKETPVWSHDTQIEFDLTKTHCEKFLFHKLHPVLFASDPEDHTLNERTRERIESLAFLTAEHLDIKCVRALYLQYAAKRNIVPKEFLQVKDYVFLNEVLEQPVQFLRQMETARSPQDKLMCVKRCTMSIAQLLKSCRQDGSLPGADELVPMMIYVIKCCNPAQLHSNLKYLQRYTRPSQMIAEAGYLLTNFVSGVYFLDNVDAKALTIEPEEFDRAILQSKMQAKAAKDRALLQQQRQTELSNGNTAGVKGQRQLTRSVGNEVEEEVSLEKLLSDFKKAVNSNNRTDAVSIAEVRKRRQLTPVLGK
jgi:hypothetical protein